MELLFKPDKAVYCERTGRMESDRGYVDALTCSTQMNPCRGPHHVILKGPTVQEWRAQSAQSPA